MRRIGAMCGSRQTRGRRGALTLWGRSAIPLMGLLAVLLSACAGQQDAGAGLASDQVFTWPFPGAVTVDDQVLDPAEITAATDFQSASMIYSGLVTLDGSLHIVGDAAKSWDVADSGKKYTFHLLPGLRFSDGQPLRAADFAYSIDRALDPHLCDGTDANGNVVPYGNSIYAGNCPPDFGLTYLNHILGATERIAGNGGSDRSIVAQGDDPNKGISVIDDQTLVIRLDAPVAYFLEALTYPTAFAVEKSLIDKWKGGQWVHHLNEGGCSGPFKIGSYGDGDQKNKVLTYVPNEDWLRAHNKSMTLTAVVRPFLESVDEEYANYRKGQYDYTDVPGHDYPYARGQEDFHEVSGLQIDYFGFNFLTPPFDSLQVRQAFDLALNKQLLVDRIYGGGAIPTNHIVPQGMPGFFPGLLNPPPDRTQSLTGNQDAAATLMDQVRQGCTGKPATDPDWCPYVDFAHYPSAENASIPTKEIDVYTNSANQTRIDLVKAAADEWSAVLHLNVQEKDVKPQILGAMIDPSKGANGYSAWNIGWLADYPDPQDFLSLQFSHTSPNNSAHLQNSALDALFQKADLEQDPLRRMDFYHQAEQQVVDQVAWLPYQQKKLTWRQRTWVHGFSLNQQESIPDIAWPDVYIVTH
jgi:oligopeptide transport system substrate-binding protein